MITLKPTMVQSLGMRQINQISYMWNGKAYVYNGDIDLLDEEVVNGLMHKRVLAVRNHSRKSPPFSGRVVGAISRPGSPGYRIIVYLIERDEDGQIVQGVNLKSIE